MPSECDSGECFMMRVLVAVCGGVYGGSFRCDVCLWFLW